MKKQLLILALTLLACMNIDAGAASRRVGEELRTPLAPVVNNVPPSPVVTSVPVAPVALTLGAAPQTGGQPNLKRVLRVLKALQNPVGASQGMQPGPQQVALTATRVATSGNPSNWKTPFIPVQSANAPIMYQTVSCAQGLDFLHIAINSVPNQDYVVFRFEQLVMSQLTSIMAQGMYILINLVQNSGVNLIQVALTDLQGNICAQGVYPMPVGATGGPKYAYLGFNTRSTIGNGAPTGANQTYINWIDLAQGCRVLYKYTAGTTTQGQGGTSTTPPAPITFPLILQPNNIVMQSPALTAGTFVPNNLPATYNLLSTTPFSCEAGLQSVNVGVTDADETSFLSFEFDTTVMANPEIVNVANQGLYINVIVSEPNQYTNGKYSVTAQLLDANQKLWAYGTYMSSNIGALDHWNLGLNTSDSTNVNGSTMLGYDKIPLNTTVLYQQTGTTVSQPVGANSPN